MLACFISMGMYVVFYGSAIIKPEQTNNISYWCFIWTCLMHIDQRYVTGIGMIVQRVQCYSSERNISEALCGRKWVSICRAEVVGLSRRRGNKTSVQQCLPVSQLDIHFHQAAVNATCRVYVCVAKNMELWWCLFL